MKTNWNRSMVAELKRVYKTHTAVEISKMKMFKGISVNGIHKKASRIGISNSTKSVKPVAKTTKRVSKLSSTKNIVWTPERVSFLKKNYSRLTVEQIQKNRLFKGFTYKSITNKAWRLKITN